MKKRVFRSSGWWWPVLTLVLPLGLAIILDSARARVGSAVQGAAEDVVDASQENATSAADVIIKAQKEMRQSQIDNLAAMLCQELRRNNYQISDNFFTKFRDFVAKENASLSADVGTRFDPKYEATTEPSAISIVVEDVQHIYSCKLRNPRPDSKPTDDELKTASCPAEGSPLDEKDLGRLAAAVEEAAKEIPGVVFTCRPHQKKSELGGICVGRCPEDRPLYIGLVGDGALAANEIEANGYSKFIDDHCSACPEDRPHYDNRSNECLRCKPSEASSSAEGTSQEAPCVECPYGFEPTEDEMRCRGTEKACEVCQRAAEVVENWSIEDFMAVFANTLSSCIHESTSKWLEEAKTEALRYYETNYRDCFDRFVGAEFHVSHFFRSSDLCYSGRPIGLVRRAFAKRPSCLQQVKKASIKGLAEIRARFQEPDLESIRRQLEVGK